MIISLGFGAGTNSTAIITGWVEKQLPPMDCILFADTGGELPETYDHVAKMSEFCVQNGLPPIITVRRTVRKEIAPFLEDDLLKFSNLPPIVFGFKTCSQKFKIVPQDKYLKQNYLADFKSKSITKLIGYDFSESRRWMKAEKLDLDNFWLQFPLVEWEWDRAAYVASIKRMGLSQPGKTSCFFCPNMRKPEIISLSRTHPDLYRRAIEMEQKALASGKIKSPKVKGLGRQYSWESLLVNPDAITEDLDKPKCDFCTDFE